MENEHDAAKTLDGGNDTQMSGMTVNDFDIMTKITTQKKCQPAAVDMPDLIQTEHVNSSGLACQKKKKKKKALRWKMNVNLLQH